MQRRLGVNIDHIATLREARKVSYPSPVGALEILKDCQVDQVTIHLREDRRHIQDKDLEEIVWAKLLPVNLELAVTDEMVEIAAKIKPATATFVPEKREEITTEGGLDCVKNFSKVSQAVKKLQDCGIRCSLFIDPDKDQILAAQEIGVEGVEIHTGTYCDALEKVYEKYGSYSFDKNPEMQLKILNEIQKIAKATKIGKDCGLKVFAGHGLHVQNLAPIVNIKDIEEYNIGHAIIARSIFVGLKNAICEIQEVLAA